jgi:hypothetical protein
MARPIKETPILKGKDARRFEEAIKKNEKKKVSAKQYQRAMKVYASVKILD